MARGIGETAPVLLTAGAEYRHECEDPFTGLQETLPTFIITNILDYGQFTTYLERAFGAGFALMLVVVILFTIARFVGGGRPGELSKRQLRKIKREEARS